MHKYKKKIIIIIIKALASVVLNAKNLAFNMPNTKKLPTCAKCPNLKKFSMGYNDVLQMARYNFLALFYSTFSLFL